MNIKKPNHTLSLSDGTSIIYSDIIPLPGGRVLSRVISKPGGKTVTLKSGEGRSGSDHRHVKGTWMTFLPVTNDQKAVFIPREIEAVPVEEIAVLL